MIITVALPTLNSSWTDVSLGVECFDLLLIYWSLPEFTKIYWNLLEFTGIYLEFTGIYWGFSILYLQISVMGTCVPSCLCFTTFPSTRKWLPKVRLPYQTNIIIESEWAPHQQDCIVHANVVFVPWPNHFTVNFKQENILVQRQPVWSPIEGQTTSCTILLTG